ncbi:MAG: TlpA disulfide reductase family protein [Acidobacteriota bacterium]
MALLGAGDLLPILDLVSADGRPARPSPGDTLYGFFKTTCPTCELTWPYLERLREMGAGHDLSVVAVSQDPPAETARFNERLGIAIPTLFDPRPWKVSDAVGLSSVPTLFLVDGEGRIRETILGFQKRKLEELARRAVPPDPGSSGERPFFRRGESVPAMQPG